MSRHRLAATRHHRSWTGPGAGSPSSARHGVAALVVGALAVLLAGCAPVPAPNLPRRVASLPISDRPAVPDVRAVAYGADAAHRLDIYRRTTGPARGTIVWIHGGGFTAGSRSDLLSGSADVVVDQRRRGFDVVAVDYRLAPEHPFPAARDDVAAAVRWVRDTGPSLELSTRRIVLVGHSAGGTLAAMVGTTPGASTSTGPVPRVDAWVSVAGMASFDPVHMIEDFPGAWGLGSDQQRRSAEPIATIDATDPPGLLIHGDRDLIVRDWHATSLFTNGWLRGAPIRIDRVGVGPSACRGHEPLCGADIDLFEQVLG